MKKTTLMTAFMALILFAVIVLAVVFTQLNDSALRRGEIVSGEDVIHFHSEGGMRGHRAPLWSEQYFRILSQREFAGLYPGAHGLYAGFRLPADAENIKHHYQFTPVSSDTGESVLHDEVYTWETPYSGSCDQGMVTTVRTTGVVKLLNDRGYVQAVLTREDSPLSMHTEKKQGQIPFSSKINGKRVSVGENPAGLDGRRETGYEVIIKDIDGQGTDCYLRADGVSREYLVYMLQTVCGAQVSRPRSAISAARNQSVLSDAKKRLAIENTAKSIISKEIETERSKGISNLQFLKGPYYEGKIKNYNGKRYNVTADYLIIYYGNREELFTVEAKRYMLIKPGPDGSYREVGSSLLLLESEKDDSHFAKTYTQHQYLRPGQTPYIAKISKKAAEDKTRKQIIRTLFGQMESALGQKEQVGRAFYKSFIMTGCKDEKILSIKQEAPRLWMVEADAKWKYVGYCDLFGFSGDAFGEKGLSGWAPHLGDGGRFVLRESADAYYLQTYAAYKGKL